MTQPRRWKQNDERRLQERHFEAPTLAHPRGIRSATYFAAWHLPSEDIFSFGTRKTYGSGGSLRAERVLCGEENRRESTTGFYEALDHEDPRWLAYVDAIMKDEVEHKTNEELGIMPQVHVPQDMRVCMHCTRAFAKEYVPGAG